MSKIDYFQLTLNHEGSDDPDVELDDGLVVEEAQAVLRPPPKYSVIMVNDDFTPMDFVVAVLQKFFNMTLEQATEVMLAVHTKGRAVCGTFTKDIAETKAAQVNQLARENQHPLLCEIEQAQA